MPEGIKFERFQNEKPTDGTDIHVEKIAENNPEQTEHGFLKEMIRNSKDRFDDLVQKTNHWYDTFFDRLDEITKEKVESYLDNVNARTYDKFFQNTRSDFKDLGLSPDEANEKSVRALYTAGIPGKIAELHKRGRVRSAELQMKIDNMYKEIIKMSSPEVQLADVKQSTNKEDRDKRTVEFKDRLITLKSGLATAQEQIIDTIREDPNISFEDLKLKFNELKKGLKVPFRYQDTAESMLKDYTEKHKLIRNIREAHPDNNELYQALFGTSPIGKIEVIEGPITLFFRCHELEDYTQIFHGVIEHNRVTAEMMERANRSAGITVSNILVEGLEKMVLVENARSAEFDEDSRATLIHEEQHAIKNLFGNRFQLGRRFQYARELQESDDSNREQRMRRDFRARRQMGEEFARDEILAYMKEEVYHPDTIFTVLSRKKEEGGLYDYFDGSTEVLTDDLTTKIAEIDTNQIHQVAEEVFDHEYRKVLREGTDAFTTLREAEYTIEETIAILIQEPLTRWKKIAQRMTSQNKKE